MSAELQASRGREEQLRKKLDHEKNERQRERHKLDRTLDDSRIKQAGLYLGYISAIYRLYLGHVSAMSRLLSRASSGPG